jgi:hypothetical protein
MADLISRVRRDGLSLVSCLLPRPPSVESAYSHLSPQQCQEEALRLYHDFLATEQSYQTSLQFFIANFIQTFSLRDSSFKRSFLNEYSIALSFTLIQEIYKSSAQLLSTLLSSLRAAASAVS